MLESMVENLKAEVYDMRLRLMAKGVGESYSSGQSSGGDTGGARVCRGVFRIHLAALHCADLVWSSANFEEECSCQN